MRLHHKPFAIRRIAFVPHALAPILWPSDFGPDHRVLLRIDPIRRNHNWLKSLSFFFSQTLRDFMRTDWAEFGRFRHLITPDLLYFLLRRGKVGRSAHRTRRQ